MLLTSIKNLAQVQAIFFIYLIMFAFGEEPIRQFALTMPVGDIPFLPPLPEVKKLELAERSPWTRDCISFDQDVFVEVQDEMYQIITPSGGTICNLSDAEPIAREMLFPNSTLEERAAPAILSCVVSLTWATAGPITLVLAGLGFVLGMIALIMWLAKSPSGSKVESSRKRSDDLLELAYPKTLSQRASTDVPNNVTDTQCGPCRSPPAPKHVKVTWADQGDTAMDEWHVSQTRDHQIAKSCIDKMVKKNKKAARGCCAVQFHGKNGRDYKTHVGAATLHGSEDFHCHF